jgi:predicted transcriptional regulator
MLNKSTDLSYPIAMLKSSGKKTFENMSRFLNQSGDSVKRLLKPMEETDFISPIQARKA